MTIAFLSYYSGLSNRGAETYVLELSNQLIKLGHTVQVFNHQQLSSPSDFPKFITEPDIVIPVNGRLQSIKASLWAKTHHKKIIISGQSGPGWDDRLNLFTFPTAFVGLTDYQCSWAKKVNPLVKTTKIPNGVDLVRFNPQVKPLSINLPHPIILYTAALEPIKRHSLLIEAVKKTKASLVLVGTGSLYDQISDQGKTQLGLDRFKIMSKPYDQMPSIYTACDLFAYPTSPWESFGIAMLEAMASNLPIVATNDPIRKEIIKNAGLFTDPCDTSSFSKTLEQALSSDWQTKPLIQAARFSWDNIGELYQNLCKSL